ncbi:SDR family oxidoreductase [Modestobacter muralis]
MLGVDGPADGQAAQEGVAHLDQQGVQPPDDGVGGVVHGLSLPGGSDVPGRLRGVSSTPRPLTLVTGGSQGIGAATAVHLAGLGHDVVVGYHSSASEAGAVVAAAQALGVRAVAVRADVADPAGVDALFDAAAELGPVTGLVANAGLTAHLGDLADTPVEVVRQVLDVNLLGVVLCARRAAQVMSRRRGGVGGAIVTVSSGAATLGSPHEYVHYAAAKAGVDALTMGLAKELADDGVRVNAVAPGLVRTGIHAGAGDAGRLDRVVARVPMGRAGEPDEIAPAIAWLLGPEASYCTGAVLRVAGGL